MSIDRLEQIKFEIRELADEALAITKELAGKKNKVIAERAKVYWHGEICVALDEENDYVGQSGCNLEETIDELNDVLAIAK